MDNHYSLRPTNVSGVGVLTTPAKSSSLVPLAEDYPSAVSSIQVSLSQSAQDPNSSAARAVDQYEQMAQQYGRQADGVQPAKEVDIRDLEPVKLFTEADVQAYEKTLSNKLAAAGVDTSIPIKFGFDFEGNVIVKNDHPDKDKIEAVFKDDQDLRNGMVQTSNHYLFKELYRLNQEWAAKIESGVSEEAAANWLLDSAKKATAKAAEGVTFQSGKTVDPFGNRGGGELTSSMKQAYGVV